MRFTDFFIDHPTTTTLITAAIAGFGALCYFSLPVSNLPEVEYPSIYVSANLPGANPDVMASTVATPLESTFSMIPGLANMTSSSTTGQTNISLQFELNRNIDAAAQDVQAAIVRASGDLPANMPSPPAYSKVNQTDEPILWLEMSSNTLSLEDFAQYANDVFAKRIAMVSGVSQVPVWGPERPAIRVQADPSRLAAYGLDLEQVRTALSTNSASLPSGMLFGDARDYSLQTNSQLTSAEQFSNVIVAWRDGVPLHLNQVADVINSSSNDRSRFWINGQRSVILAVRKQPGVNTVEVADHVKEVIRTLRSSLPPGVSFGKVADEADQVRDSIAEVSLTLLITVALVVAVIFAFLGTASSTLVAAATISVSVLGSFIVMRLLGYSVDMFSMMGITLSVGFIVDDAIVMIENIVRHQEMGKSRIQAGRGVSLDSATRLIRSAASRIGIPATLTFSFQGTAAQFQSSLKGLGLLLLIAVMVIYLVLGVLYESFIHPITILSGLPPAAIGALLALLLFGQDLNLYSFLGIILLIGIVKKNAIMIVDFALNAQRAENLDPTRAIYQGCLQRFRPIMMTTMAALLGAMPVALAGGVGGEARRPLGIAVVGGLLLSQLLTLYVTPVIYLSFTRLLQKPAANRLGVISAERAS